jgi:Flagellar protein YcgR
MTEDATSTRRASSLDFGAPVRRASDPDRPPLERLARAYGDMSRRARLVLSLTPGTSRRSFDVSLLGMLRERRCLLISAPANADKSLIAITRDSTVSCRWVNPTAAFEFSATVANLLFEPVPIVVLADLGKIKKHSLRAQPRALTALAASLRAPEPQPAIITDMSLSGARIGAATELTLDIGAALELSLRPRLIDREMILTLRGSLTHRLGQCDADHPAIHFYGIQFERPDDHSALALHTVIQERLVMELDFVSALLETSC